MPKLLLFWFKNRKKIFPYSYTVEKPKDILKYFLIVQQYISTYTNEFFIFRVKSINIYCILNGSSNMH